MWCSPWALSLTGHYHLAMTRPTGAASVAIDLITEQQAIGELAKLAHFLGFEAKISRSETMGAAMVLNSTKEHWLSTLIACLASLEAVARDETIDSVLDSAREQVKAWHFPMNAKPSDARPLGSGHVDDE